MSAPGIFDRTLYRRRRARAARMTADRFLLHEAADALAERIGAVNRRFAQGLELASRPDSAAMLAPLADRWTRMALTGPEAGHVVGDDETLPFAPESFDLIVSCLSLHAVNDLPGALVQIRRVLKPDGLFVAALLGGETLGELREAFAAAETAVRGGVSPRVHPFADVRALGGLMQRAGFKLPVVDCERTDVEYKKINSLFDDLRALGEGNCLVERECQPVSRRLIRALAAEYQARHATAEGRFKAGFDIIYLTGWAPHESQQKPLQPGSAQASLADVLGKPRI